MKPLNTKPSRRLQRGDAQFDLDLLAVAPHRLDLEAAAEDPGFAGAQEPLQAGLMRVAVDVGGRSVRERASEHLVARPAEDLLGLRIPVRDHALLVDLDEGVERGLDDAARQLFAFAQGFAAPAGSRSCRGRRRRTV